jgi:hypothetical protein
MSKRNSEDRASSCSFTFSDGRQCRMLRSSKRSKYCLHHERKLLFLKESGELASDLYKPISDDFVHHAGLTRSLARFLAQVAEGRVKAKDAVAMARVADTLLKSISLAMSDFRETHRLSYFGQLVRRSFGKLPPFVPPYSSKPQPSAEDHTNKQLPETGEEFAKQVLEALER